MSTIDSMSPRGFQLGNTPVLRGADLVKEAESMTPEVTDLGNGVVVERRGNMFKMVGSAKVSMRAMAAAYEAARMGGDAGRAMFETYRKNNPDEFDPSKIFDPSKGMPEITRAAQSAPAPDATTPSVRSEGGKVSLTGSAVDDFFAVLRGFTAYGLGGNDRLVGDKQVTLDGGDGDDVLSAFQDSTLYGGAGNDHLSAYERSVLDGGDGDDVLSAYEDSTLVGGAGNDRLSAYGNSVLDGGTGDDRISGYDKTRVADADGDNDIQVYDDSRVTAGAGNDRIQVSDRSVVDAGDGFNFVTAGGQATITSGDGADMVMAGDGGTVSSGSGDDLVKVGRGSEVTTGLGDDRLMVGGGGTIHFNRGDGNDSIGGGEFGQAYAATDNLSSSILSFGTGIAPADLVMQRKGNDLVIQVGASDSITLKDVQRHGIPTMTFADGSVLAAAQVEAAVGPAEPYQPMSQVVQRWYDANAAYRAQQQVTDAARMG